MRINVVHFFMVVTAVLGTNICPRSAEASPTKELVYVDKAGVIRWTDTNQEVALFGANYCLSSASDYPAAGYVHADRKRLATQDMSHFARMEFDAVRLCFWGDWENSDGKGNLIPNDHLDVLDYTIYQAKQYHVFILLSPIVTYSSLWPDLQDDPSVVGFSRHFEKSELGTNPEAIAAQQNYLEQLLNHVNPYTQVALKDEPQILFVEMINEPWHHSNDVAGSVRYINALVDAVRSTGCQKLTFHNLSQEFAMAGPINDSKVDGESFAWYPSGLNSGHQLRGNFLPFVDVYPPMMAAEVQHKPRIVYEFDLPDVISGYHYPAMARVFREAGAQWATMFSYDMLATAPYNLGWTTHLLNLVYTPHKAAAAVIAGAAMHELPRNQQYGPMPEDSHFGNFMVSNEDDVAVLANAEQFMYSNDTAIAPPAPASLKQIVGFGSSPIVKSDGVGIYFLDKVDQFRWRLELYPDSVQVDDPFHNPHPGDVKFRLIARPVNMTISLPDLGDTFDVRSLNEGNTFTGTASRGGVTLFPGVYLLSGVGNVNKPLPEQVHGIGMHAFVCPPIPPASPTILTPSEPEHSAGQPLQVITQVLDDLPPQSVALLVKSSGAGIAQPILMTPHGRYGFTATIPAENLHVGTLSYAVLVKFNARRQSSSGESDDKPSSPVGTAITLEEDYTTEVVSPSTDVELFQPEQDFTDMSQSRAGWAKPVLVAGSKPDRKAAVVNCPSDTKNIPNDFSRSMYVGDRIAARSASAKAAGSLVIKLRGLAGTAGEVHIILVEKGGFAWAADVKAAPEWREVIVPVDALKPTKWVLLPEGYPGDWAQSAPPVVGSSDHPEMANVERMQLSLVKSDFGDVTPDHFGVELEGVWLRRGFD